LSYLPSIISFLGWTVYLFWRQCQQPQGWLRVPIPALVLAKQLWPEQAGNFGWVQFGVLT